MRISKGRACPDLEFQARLACQVTHVKYEKTAALIMSFTYLQFIEI